MKATLSTRKSEFTTSHRRESGGLYKSFQVIDIAAPRTYGDPARLHAAVELRLYAPGTRIYACLWISSPAGLYISGSGYAGGYGYCKASAAAGSAIRAAGIDLYTRIDGVGEEAIREALVSIARDICGATAPAIMESHA